MHIGLSGSRDMCEGRGTESRALSLLRLAWVRVDYLNLPQRNFLMHAALREHRRGER